MQSYIETQFRMLVAIPIVVMALLQITTSVKESQTFDEGVHLSAGYRYWLTGDFRLNVEHPPLQKLLSALPLLVVHPPLPADVALLTDQTEFARTFFYKSGVNADRLFFYGRLPTMLLSVLLCAALALVARFYFGAAAALGAVWLCALDPNLIAHGRYVTTDVISALLFFLTVVLWVRYWQAPTRAGALRAAVAGGLALTAKFSMLLLVPLVPGLLVLYVAMCRPAWRVAGRYVAALAGAGVLALLMVGLIYAPETWRVLRGRPIYVSPETIGRFVLPASSYLTGLRTLMDHNQEGHTAFLLGQVSDHGWWYYFPVVFLVKSPLAVLILTAFAAGAGLWKVKGLWRAPQAGFIWAALAAAPLAYFAVTLTSHINLGVRHLLPVYPFLYLLGMGAAARLLPPRKYWLVAGLLVGLQAVECAAIYPDYLGFFNAAAGGSEAGPRYLLDSNIDWGQDLKKLKTYMDAHPGPVCLDYFGSVYPQYYGIQYEYLPKTWDKDERERANCIGAISLTLLQDLYLRSGSYAWLRERRPMGRVGSSIALFDLRKPPAQ